MKHATAAVSTSSMLVRDDESGTWDVGASFIAEGSGAQMKLNFESARAPTVCQGVS